jgi:hypothetical protein
MSKTGIAGMVQSAAWMSHQMDLEVVAFGRAGDAPKDSCLLQMTGRFLAYDVFLDGGFVFLDATSMDQAEGASQRLLTIGDTEQGWSDLCRLVQALERNQIRDVKVRPLEIGESGNRDSWVIGD